MQISLKIEHRENRGFSQKVQNCTIKCKRGKKLKRFQPFPYDILFTGFCSFFWFNPNKILLLLMLENKELLVNLNATMLNICLLSEHVCCSTMTPHCVATNAIPRHQHYAAKICVAQVFARRVLV